MSTRLDADAQAALANLGGNLAPALPGAVAPIAFDPDERYDGPALPSDHPAWMRDTVSLSQRARALLDKVKPVAIRAIAYWEHRLHAIVVGGRRVGIDASGSYRLD